MLSSVKPTQVAGMLAAVFLLLVGIFGENFPRIFDILLGCYVGIIWGSTWNDENQKWREKYKEKILRDSSFVMIDEKLHRIKNIYYIWLAHQIAWIAVGLIAFSTWGVLFLSFIDYVPWFSWYINIPLAMVFGLILAIISVLPGLLLIHVKKKENFNFLKRHKRLLSYFDADD